MRKTVNAWAIGYFVFEVNGESFKTYGAAETEALRLIAGTGEVYFTGWNVWRWLLRRDGCGWARFLHRPAENTANVISGNFPRRRS